MKNPTRSAKREFGVNGLNANKSEFKMADEKWKLKQQIHIEYDSHDGSGILIDTREASFCSYNPTAKHVLEALQKGVKLDEIVTEIQKHYHANKTVIRQDVLNFIQQLDEMGYINEVA